MTLAKPTTAWTITDWRARADELAALVAQQDATIAELSRIEAASHGPALLLTLPVPPSANTYWRHVGHRVLLSADARAYRHTVAQSCLIQRVRPLTGDITVSIVWYRARKSGDPDNRIKQLLDALRGHAYGDDAQVADCRIRRLDTEPRNARVAVAIRQVPS